ncbi:tyrosine-protein phosphatase [Mucilaginibacter arboris]|uniref:protein-tyrosine-phosphatase n=1 Tax=Mucilaginibacter arboris TaxID=2682090 RepID=A0A7K1T0X2_9SPHI|nr:CpsB/CapC family capsule biosynthesis tyrosine phosphatase [Mucilaginibacter arboris]MVN23214.1 capsular biosynthesis protein [Mucilaginibacter arboris]
MFGIFSKKRNLEFVKPLDFSTLAVDMHSHVLPGIDDGAQTVEESVVLVQAIMNLGIKKIIATPHIMVDYYRNNAETIGSALQVLRNELQKQHIEIEIEAAAEHYLDEAFETLLDEDKVMPMKDGYLLFEMSFIDVHPNLIPIIQKMIDKGYKPILAHPERYPYLSIENCENIKSWGCNLQMNTISLTGYYGGKTKAMAEAMIDHNMVDFISSDMHHIRHAQALEKSLKTPYIEKLLYDYPLKNQLLL